MFDLIKNTINHILSPNLCLICEKLINNDDSYNIEYLNVSNHLCKNCYYNLPLVENQEEIKLELLKNIKIEDIFIDNFYSLLNKKQDDRYVNLIYGLKYEKRQNISKTIAVLLSKLHFENEVNNTFQKTFNYYNVFIPVPIHHARKRERGFNQAELISIELSKLTGVPTNLIVKRTINNQTQTKLTQKERQLNISNIFTANNLKSKNMIEEYKTKKVLIIDDVLTTGATVNSIAKELRIIGFTKIDVLTLIKA